MNRMYRNLWLPVLLLIYVTASYIYLYFKGQLPMNMRTFLFVGASYLCVAGIFFFRMKRIKREKEWEEKHKKESQDAMANKDNNKSENTN